MGLLSLSSSTAQMASVTPDSLRDNPSETEQKTPLLTIAGSVDAYFKYEFAKSAANSYTSFTQSHNSFALGMASLRLEHKSEKITALIDLGFGQRARDFSYADEGITQAIKQLYVSYSPADWLKLTAGTWATHVGYELLDPQLNRNYSMSYMFTYGPFSHTGLKAELSRGSHALMLGISNATDFRMPPDGQINRKFIIAQYSLSVNENIKVYLNYVDGKNPDTSKTRQLDAVMTAGISDRFSIGFNGTLNSTRAWDGIKNTEANSWWGSALYLNFDPLEWFGLTLRCEWFSDEHGLKTFSAAPAGGRIFSNTLSASFRSGGFIFIPEIRVDRSDKKVLFIGKNGGFTSTTANVLLAAIYSF